MTVQTAMERALALLPVKPAQTDGLMDYAIHWANLAAAECLPCEKAIRAARGEEEPAASPEFSSLSDEIPYSEAVLTPFIYALGSLAAKDDGDSEWMATLRARFSGSLQELTPWVSGTIENVYGGGEA